MFVSVLFLVCVLFVVCCVAVCNGIGLSCVYVLLLLFCFRFVFGYGLNAFPVCECILHVPVVALFFHLCVMLFVCLCVYAMACICCLRIDFIGLFCV